MRSSMFDLNGVYTEDNRGGVAVMERPAVAQPDVDESEAIARRKRNLERLLNYDAVEETPQVEVATAVQTPEVAVNEDDITPTTTTMQFGEGEVEEMYNEMASEETDQKTGYKMTLRGKIAIALYSVAVAIIMALIIINTGVLANLSSVNQSAQAELDAKMTAYQELDAEIEKQSSVGLQEFIDEYGLIQK